MDAELRGVLTPTPEKLELLERARAAQAAFWGATLVGRVWFGGEGLGLGGGVGGGGVWGLGEGVGRVWGLGFGVGGEGWGKDLGGFGALGGEVVVVVAGGFGLGEGRVWGFWGGGLGGVQVLGMKRFWGFPNTGSGWMGFLGVSPSLISLTGKLKGR